MKTAVRPWLSGFCNPSNPPEIHAACVTHPRADGVPCSCACHDEVHAVILDTPAAFIVTDAAPETPEWFAARRDGITGTDLPKILGLSKYGNALSVWLDKRGEIEDEAGEAALWGTLLEDVVAREWAARVGAEVVPIGVAAHADHPQWRASLDRRVIRCPEGDGECALEVKTRSAFVARAWRDGIPDDVLAQVQWGLMVTGYDHMHVAALIGGQRLQTYRIDADEAIHAYLLDAARPVWQAVQDGVPPEAHPDAEGVLLDLLDRVYRDRSGERDLDPLKAGEWLDQYREGSDLAKRAEALKTEAKTALVQMLDDGDTGLVDGKTAFTYKAPGPSDSLPAANLRALAEASPEIYAALKDDGYITTTAPRPRFALKEN